MARRRMFSLDVVDTDSFLDLPVSAQALYFHLGMRADDDGFISSPKRITTIAGCNIDDLKILVAKGYVIPFESGVYVITHWRKNNYVRCDRYTQTEHPEEMGCLILNNGRYTLRHTGGIPNDIPTGYTDKNRIDKNRIDKKNTCTEPEQGSAPCRNSGLLIPLNDGTSYDVPLDKIETWKAAYPAVDVVQEIKKMVAWCESNPKNKKTLSGVNRFINGWLAKTQNRGGSSSSEKKPANRFNNFQQRGYDFDDLEKSLLN